MDIDMHYYGTYALARAAGISDQAALRIATAAEFVDDSTATDVIAHPDGARFRGEATAHHPTDLRPIRDPDDQITVWVPFHFLPGGVGDTQSQRLRCVKDSAPARKMVNHHLMAADKFYALELLGITAHVYADTFAHYGFSGVSSRVNRIDAPTLKSLNGDPLLDSSKFFLKFGEQGGLLKNLRNRVASVVFQEASGALGHGAVATFPDQPYLEWAYEYQMPEIVGVPSGIAVERQNAKDFVEGAEALHTMFRKFASVGQIYADERGGYDFDDIRTEVARIVGIVGNREQRIAAWKTALQAGTFSRNGGESVPDYSHDDWRRQTNDLASLPTPQVASATPAYHFHFAAAIHRHFVLRELLPDFGIFII